MELITEVYHDSYQPKLDIDNYAYVDNTNKDIVYRMARKYFNQLPSVNVEEHLVAYNLNIKRCACVVYFKSTGLSYDCLHFWPIDNTYAAKHKYNVIKITEPQSLITMD